MLDRKKVVSDNGVKVNNSAKSSTQISTATTSKTDKH